MEGKNNLNIKPDEIMIPEGLPGGFFIYNAEGNFEILYADQNIIALYECKDIAEFREFTGNSFTGMVHPDDFKKIDNDIMAQTFNSSKKHDYVRYRIITRSGAVKYIEDFGHLLHGRNGEKYFYVYIVDIDKDEFYNRGRNSFAETQIFSNNRNSDRLTGLMNMHSFYEDVQNKLGELSSEERKEVKFVHFDILSFKLFNEKYGFQRGDDLLCRMAYIIRDEFKDSFVARFSNDHIVVCTKKHDVIMKVENVHNSMLTAIEGIRVEIKAGIYILESDCNEVGIACDHARLACNMIKHRYDRIYEIYEKGIHEKLKMQQHVLDNIDTAIEKEYIKVFYQPVIRVSTGRICGYEALARWQDPETGMLSPAQFIGTLEEYHMIHKVDIFIINKVCEDLSRMMDAGKKIVPVSLNLSQLDFELCDIFTIIEQIAGRYGLSRDLLDIEITESALNNDSEHISEEVKKFKDAGYSIWIDDFGSGYSSLNHLLDFEFDVIKLDLEFLRTYDKHPKASELIRHIVQGALDMGVSPLQEGVETKVHLDFLASIGCERAQGYYFAKPLPLNESIELTMSKGLGWE